MVETTARQFVFSALIFTAIIAGAFGLLSMALPENHQNFITYNTTYNRLTEIRDDASSIEDGMSPDVVKPESGLLGVLNGLIQSSWGAISGVWDSLGVMTAIITDSSDSDGVLGVVALPNWFTGLIIGILGVTVAFAIMAAIFKWHI